MGKKGNTAVPHPQQDSVEIFGFYLPFVTYWVAEGFCLGYNEKTGGGHAKHF